MVQSIHSQKQQLFVENVKLLTHSTFREGKENWRKRSLFFLVHSAA